MRYIASVSWSPPRQDRPKNRYSVSLAGAVLCLAACRSDAELAREVAETVVAVQEAEEERKKEQRAAATAQAESEALDKLKAHVADLQAANDAEKAALEAKLASSTDATEIAKLKAEQAKLEAETAKLAAREDIVGL